MAMMGLNRRRVLLFVDTVLEVEKDVLEEVRS
jgi:hypothetical protein